MALLSSSKGLVVSSWHVNSIIFRSDAFVWCFGTSYTHWHTVKLNATGNSSPTKKF